jgi:predicted transglutaminase-like cysteine proteinase
LNRSRLGELLVAKGLITTKQLREALRVHKETHVPLGHVFVTQRVISKRQLNAILRRQHMLRCLTTGVLLFASVGSSKKLMADVADNAPVQVASAAPAMGQEFKKVTAYPPLLGMAEKRNSNLGPFTKWTGLFNTFDRQIKGNDPKIREWQNGIAGYKSLPLKTMAARVNDYVNKTPYVSDSKNWGRSDYWVTPADFITRGGDCEDFAIAKYVALRTLGVPEERLRIAIVHDTQKNIPHAVLIVYTDEGSYILDNQNKSLADAERAGRYRPVFSINRQAWWLHTAPGATVVASAR